MMGTLANFAAALTPGTIVSGNVKPLTPTVPTWTQCLGDDPFPSRVFDQLRVGPQTSVLAEVFASVVEHSGVSF